MTYKLFVNSLPHLPHIQVTEGNCGTVMTEKLGIRFSLLSFFTTRPCWGSSSLIPFLFVSIVWLLLLFHCCSAWNCLCHDFSFPDLTYSTLIFCPSVVSKAFTSQCTQTEERREGWRGERESLHLSFPGLNNFVRYLPGILPTTKSDSTTTFPMCSCRFK